MLVDDAPGTPGGVATLWAWVAIDAMGGEGIVGGQVSGLGAVPFVTGSERVAREVYGPLIAQMPATGRRFELRRYDLASTT